MGQSASTAQLDFDAINVYDVLGVAEDATSDDIRVISFSGTVAFVSWSSFVTTSNSSLFANERLNIIQIKIPTISKEPRSGSLGSRKHTRYGSSLRSLIIGLLIVAYFSQTLKDDYVCSLFECKTCEG
jgi:hypothetical protein